MKLLTSRLRIEVPYQVQNAKVHSFTWMVTFMLLVGMERARSAQKRTTGTVLRKKNGHQSLRVMSPWKDQRYARWITDICWKSEDWTNSITSTKSLKFTTHWQTSGRWWGQLPKTSPKKSKFCRTHWQSKSMTTKCTYSVARTPTSKIFTYF